MADGVSIMLSGKSAAEGDRNAGGAELPSAGENTHTHTMKHVSKPLIQTQSR